MPRFLILGHEFRFNRNDFKGPVIASADAFYFVINKYGLADGTGILGGLLTCLNEHLGKKTSANDYMRDLAELPPEITQDPDWPIDQPFGPVLIIPRSVIVAVTVPRFWLNNRVYVCADGLEVSVVYNLFRRGKIRRFLAEIGWTAASQATESTLSSGGD